MNIRIVNLKTYEPVEGERLFRCDRQSPIGNPFAMYSEAQRDEVCDRYEEHFNSLIAYYKQVGLYHLSSKQQDFISYLARIANYYLAGNDIALGCWCFPKRCHCSTIKRFLESLKP